MTSNQISRGLGLLLLLHTPILLAGCSSLGASGPTTSKVRSAERQYPDIKIVDVTEAVSRKLASMKKQPSFAESFGEGVPVGSVIGAGDIIDISIWEAPPAALFGAASADTRLSTALARSSEIPQQMVDTDGRITVPFVGSLQVAGLTPQQVARKIVAGLKGRAHQPQAVVRIADNQTANATVIGDVTSSKRVPLTTKGERVLDALAAAGGVRQPVDKMVIQVTRGNQVVREPLSVLVSQPHENIRLAPNDVVTALFQPYSFQALGALGTSAEVNFEGTGLTLAQALARAGGLQDNRADVKGVFIFRFENATAFPIEQVTGANRTPDGKIPVIYRIDMSDPASLFAAQSFRIEDKDVLYVSNAPTVDLQKFVTVASQMAFAAVGVTTSIR